MASQTAQMLPFAKFTRGGFGFSSKNRNSVKAVENDEDWYIPYNGPYAAPPELPNRRKARDSWGDPVEPDDDEDMMLNDKELHLRYGGYNNLNGGRHAEEGRMGRDRSRAFSVTSGQTVSSGTVDPSRPSMGVNRRSTVSSGTRQALPSYSSLDAVGGVGESPIPLHRSSKDGSRMSFAGIFNFGAQPRKPSTPAATSVERVVSGVFVRKSSILQRSNMRTGHDKERVHSKTDSPYNSSPERHTKPPLKDKHQQLHHQVMLQGDRPSSNATEDDYYNSYYSTLVHRRQSDSSLNHTHHHASPPPSEDSHHSQRPQVDQSSLDRQNSSSTNSSHPYALAIPRNSVEGPMPAPLVLPSNPPQLTFTAPSYHHSNSADSPAFSSTRLLSPRTPKLKNSISTPDMRNSATFHNPPVITIIPNTNLTPQPMVIPPFVLPKGKDRWLSAETWCDALLFPRPRLKIEGVPMPGGGSGRIVSPPDSPIGPDLAGPTGTREPGFASRVLAHSRSLVDLNRSVGLSSVVAPPYASTSVSHGQDPQAPRVTAQSKLPRPTSFAQDDLALLSPVLSLTRVLEQGHQLANERKAWQLQAQGSWGNKHTRILSKTRSKSLTQQGRRRGHQPQSSMEYLAAQACLGTQNLTPTPAVVELDTIFPDTAYASSSRKGSHSHNTSLTKTLSKSSNSHSRNHSRNHSMGDSWSRAKVAKPTVTIPGIPPSEDEVAMLRDRDRAANLEGALMRDGTKVIRLPDPASMSPNSTRLTPSPSANSDQGVGIALGTPPGEDQDDLLYLPSHPYAQGGLSFSSPSPASNQTRFDRGTEFAGPHPSINSGVDRPQISDLLARHKLPPHLLLHPYAQATARDSYLEQNGLLGQYRSGNETPQQLKMWAQLSPGVLREVLPGDFQYSPFISDKDNISPVSTTSSDPMHINDTIGVGETLVNAARFRRSPDSGIGSNGSDTHVMATKPMSQVDRGNQLPTNSLPEFGPQTLEHLAPSQESRKPSLENVILSDSPEQVDRRLLNRTDSTSPAVTSTSSSPHITPRHLGSLNDLESFQDLFYRPNNNLRQSSNDEAAFPDTPSPPNFSTAAWDRHMRKRKTESGLTSLARQLSEEVELMALERERSSSQYSSVPSPTRQPSVSVSRRPTEGSLQFTFEETSQSELLDHPAIRAFHPSDNLPEDVESSRASSLIEKIDDDNDDDDDTALLRLGVVESAFTPASVPPEYRPNSYTGETSYTTHNGSDSQDQPESSHTFGMPGQVNSRTCAGLQPPSSDVMRSSFMTTSTASRISNLSDFPAPPKDHVSLNAYFNDHLGQTEFRSQVPPPPPPPSLRESQASVGRHPDAGNQVKTSSSNPF